MIGSMWLAGQCGARAMQAVCIGCCVAAHIAPSPIVGGAEMVHALLQHRGWSGVGAGSDRLDCCLFVICCSSSCCWAMLRSSESRPRRCLMRQGLVVTDGLCGRSGSAVVACGAAGRGGDERWLSEDFLEPGASRLDIEYVREGFPYGVGEVVGNYKVGNEGAKDVT
jgi:hypothetical protein